MPSETAYANTQPPSELPVLEITKKGIVWEAGIQTPYLLLAMQGPY